MKHIIAIYFLMLIGLSSFAQTGAQISGKVDDATTKKSIEATTVNLLQAKDSAVIGTSVTDNSGIYSFNNIQQGQYLVMVSSTGFQKKYSTTFVVKQNETIHVENISLSGNPKKLEEVVVTSKKQFVERKIDKTVINPDALISNTGSTVMEVLEKSPGVTVDKDGNISLKGKQGVIVMLDGKPSYMSSADLANYLRGLSSSMIDQIEIMTNPSAKYDASGNSGIINIKTKKNKQKGFNGSLATAYGQGVYPKTNNSLNLNYRIGKINIFSNLGANYRENNNQLNINRVFRNDDDNVRSVFSQTTNTHRKNQNYNGKIGMDYYLNPKTTIGIVVSGYTMPSKEYGKSVSLLQNPLKVVDSTVIANRQEDNVWNSKAINLNLRHTFDSTGKEISADLDYIRYSSSRDINMLNSVLNSNNSVKSFDRLVADLPTDINIYSAKTDYVLPFKSGLKLEAGLKFSYVTTDNEANYFNVVNDKSTIDYGKTNQFNYKENINAAYVNFNKTVKKWGFQLGLRAENTNYEGLQFGNPTKPDSSFTNSYTSVFPTAYVSYEANAKNQFGISVGRRINRPGYEDLNPFLFYIDKYTFEEGNPFLKPMYSNVLELSHTYNQFLTTTFNYNHTTDLFNEVFRQSNQPDDSISTIINKGNYGIANNLSLSVNAQIKVAKWYKIIAYAEAQYVEFKGELNGENLNIAASNLLFNINNQFTFKKGWSAEFSGFGRTRTSEGQMSIDALTEFSTAVKKDILKGKGSLRLSIRDMFGPMKVNGDMRFQKTSVTFDQQRDTRVITLGFNYRFGKPIKGLKARKSGGAGTEQDRVKSNN